MTEPAKMHGHIMFPYLTKILPVVGRQVLPRAEKMRLHQVHVVELGTYLAEMAIQLSLMTARQGAKTNFRQKQVTK